MFVSSALALLTAIFLHSANIVTAKNSPIHLLPLVCMSPASAFEMQRSSLFQTTQSHQHLMMLMA